MTDDKVSIVIPVYNVDQYLDYCIQSVIAQDHKNIEVILVDDGSTDLSGKMCDEYAEKDARVKVIHKKNGGVSSARNAGIKAITGRYITFVDADDYIRTDYISQMMECMLLDDVDLVVCSFSKVYENVDYTIIPKEKKDKSIYDRESTIIKTASRKIPMYVHGKLYHSHMSDLMAFPEGRLYEDMPVTWSIVNQVNKVIILSDELYFYRQRPESIVHAQYKHGRMDQVYYSEEMYGGVEKDSKLGYALASRCFFSAADNYSLVTHEFPEDIAYLKNCIKKYRSIVLKDSSAAVSLKIMALVSYANIRLVRVLGKLYKKIKHNMGN